MLLVSHASACPSQKIPRLTDRKIISLRDTPPRTTHHIRPGSIDVFSALRKAQSYPVESALIMHDRFDVFLPALDVIRFKYGMNLDHLIAKDQQHVQSDMD